MSNRWHDRFNTDEYMYGQKPNEFIYEMSTHLKNHKKIVAFAEGEGRNAVFLAKNGHEVTALDYAKSGLEKTNTLAEQNGVNIETKHTNLLTDEVNEAAYDAGIMVFGHFHESDQKRVFEKLLQAVKPGGMVAVEVYSKEQIDYRTGGPRDIEWLYEPREVLEWCAPHHVIHFFYGEKMRKEGSLHTGTGHVIQILLQKKAEN